MEQESIIEREGEGLEDVINWAKGLIAKIDTQIGCAAAVPERIGAQRDNFTGDCSRLFDK